VGEVCSHPWSHRLPHYGPPRPYRRPLRRGRRHRPQARRDLARKRHPPWQIRRPPSPQMGEARPPLLIGPLLRGQAHHPLPLLHRNHPPRLSRCRPVRQNHRPLAQPGHRNHPPPGRPAYRSHPRPVPSTHPGFPPPARPAHRRHQVQPPRLLARRVRHRSLSHRGDRPA
jgi:hypothetical protein